MTKMDGADSNGLRAGGPLRRLGREVVHAWSRFWFTARDPAPLALVRVLTGAVLLWIHLTTWSQMRDAVGDGAWLDRTAVQELRLLAEGTHVRDYGQPGAPLVPASGPLLDASGQPKRDAAGNVVRPSDRWRGTFSLWHWLPETAGTVLAVQVVLAVAAGCVLAGFRTRLALAVAWLAHVSYVQRGMVIYSGMDSILLMLLLYLLVGPSGAVCSVDAWLKRGKPASGWTVPPSVAANVSLRLIQTHLCLIYLCAGAAKLQGQTWWNGNAVYLLMMSPEYGGIPVEWLARHETLWQAVSLLGGGFTVAFELSFAFLVWQPRLRPGVLGAGIVLHLMLALVSGLGAFQMAMLAALAAFLSPSLVRHLLRISSDSPAPLPCDAIPDKAA